ncbi:MAG: polysaccharide deacetylase family protein, partial [Bacteroidales bacterium]|nr:polysaccharide deacetylase family protein [Bacteroidales bacterium]
MNRYTLSAVWMITRPTIFLTRVPGKMTWELYGDKPHVYISFDDGPHPEVTPWVLERLKEFGALATFFCLGQHVEKYPEVYHRILDEGHAVGNHSFTHHKGFRKSIKSYVEDVEQAAQLIESKLFRPPFGHILPGQAKALQKQYNIVMWDVMTRDFDTNLTGEQVISHVTGKVRQGSILLFH